ncbi:phosphotransferase family protein [Halomicrococcus gelatinilyticus]|uniref:phosphotransferase family protein n=1 Tax=Halomicrococcus gelatinilyticus TaxID=1702103 RepID=UPI002E1079B1
MTTESTVRDALASQFEDVAVRDCLRRDARNTVHEVSVDGRRAVCKTTDTQPAMLAREGAVLAAVGERTAVPVPAVLAAGDGHLVLAWARGDVDDRDDPRDRRRERLRAVGRTLARLHRDTAGWFDGHGALEEGGGPLVVARPTGWPDRFAGFVDDWAATLAGTRDADAGDAVREFVGEHRHEFADRSPVLVHGEPAPDHVRFDGGEVTALLDWELAQAAPGAFDLVWAERDFLRTPTAVAVDDDLRTALHEGYEAERPLPPEAAFRCEVYRAAFAMRDLRLVGQDSEDCRESLRTYVFDRLDAATNRGGNSADR